MQEARVDGTAPQGPHRLPPGRLTVLLAAVVLAGTAVLGAADFAGTFSGDGVTLRLDAGADGAYSGWLELQGRSYPVEAWLLDEDLGGVFRGDGEEFDFLAELDGAELELMTADEIYRLRRRGSGNPPARPRNPLAGADESLTPARPQRAAGFAGTFGGAISGTPATLTVRQQGDELDGEIDAGGYRYSVEAEVEGGRAEGILSDPQTGGFWEFEAAVSDDRLILTLIVIDAATGQGSRTPLEFRRGRAAARNEARAETEATGERDPAIVGSWTRQEIVSGGGTSVATQLFLQINADGTFAYATGDTLGGGADWSGRVGGGGGGEGGRWKTQGGIVYVAGHGSDRWTPLARYYVEPGRLMFTLDGGKRELWYRR